MQLISNRFMAVILAALIMLSMLAGCKSKEPAEDTTPDASPTASATATDPDTSGETAESKYSDVYATFAPDTTMFTVDEYVVRWDELFYFLANNVASLEAELGEERDWTQSLDGTMTLAEAVITYAREDATYGKLFEYGAKTLGEKLSDDELAVFEESYAALTEQYGGEEALMEKLGENYCYSKELFIGLTRVQSLIDKCFTAVCGATGEKLTEAQLGAVTAGDGYLMAKHILCMTQNLDRTEKTDEEKAAALEKINDIYEQLEQYDGDDFDAFFDELMMANSEDSGLQAFPDGYLFQLGDMVLEFYNTCNELEIGAFSEPVKTDYGYHIIYRLPINYEVIPSIYYRNESYYPLRFIAASQMFDAVVLDWENNVEITYSKEYESIDIAAMFG